MPSVLMISKATNQYLWPSLAAFHNAMPFQKIDHKAMTAIKKPPKATIMPPKKGTVQLLIKTSQ